MAVRHCFFVLVTLQVLLFGAAIPDGEIISKPEMPEYCEQMNYCHEPGDSYPYKRISDLLTDLMEEVRRDLKKQVYQERYVGKRFGDIDLCPSTNITAPIYYIVDTTGDTRIVVQKAGVFEQIYETSECEEEGPIYDTRNNFLSKEIAQKLGAECVNKYNQVDFYVLSRDYNRIEKVQMFEGLPVYCYCRYKKSSYNLLYW